MATEILGYQTLLDVVNQYTSLDSKATYVWAANVLARKCPFIKDAPFMASNQIMSHIGSRVSYLPTPGTRRFNEGVSITAAHTQPFTDPICMVEDYSQIDATLLGIQNDKEAYRKQQDKLKVEAMTQKAEDLLIYGNIGTDPAAINGLMTRFNSTTARPNGDSTWPYNVVSAGGSGGDTTSMLAVQWGPGKVNCIYPLNLPGGLQIEDLGRDKVNTNTEAAPKYMMAYVTRFAWHFGLTVEDERCVQRYCNIEVSGADNTFDEDKLIALINNLPDGGAAPGTVIYCSRSIKTILDIRAKDKNNVWYAPDAVWGGNVTMFRGIPVRMAEKIVDTETAVV